MIERQTNTSKSEEQLAAAAFELDRESLAIILKDRARLIVQESALLGRNVLKEELGAFSDPLKGAPPYHLNEETRDRLLAHSRQDVASVYGLCAGLIDLAKEQQRALNMMKIWLSLLTVLLVIEFSWRIWAE